jgi:hypothetical protein
MFPGQADNQTGLLESPRIPECRKYDQATGFTFYLKHSK